jgi:hypothetical protein
MTNPRTHEEFNELKNEILDQITELNAAQLHELAAQLILGTLQNLNIDSITTIEDLYLIGVLLINTASYKAAQEKAAQKNISFAEAGNDIGTDEVAGTLIDTFSKYPGVEQLLAKFKEIDQIPGLTGKEPWAGLHSRMVMTTNYFEKNPVPAGDLKEKKPLTNTLDNFMISLYKVNLKDLEEQLKILPIDEKEVVLFVKAQSILNQVKAIAGEHPENLMKNDLRDLTDVLICSNAILKDRHDKEKSIKHTQKLADLTQRVSDKSSRAWKALGMALLILACATLVVVGVLAAIPSGGSSLLLTAIGTSAGLATIGLFGGGAAVYQSREKGLPKSVRDLKDKLESEEDDLTPKSSK